MKQLDLARINATSPSEVANFSRINYYQFRSDNGVHFAIGFDIDDLFLKDKSYQLIIANVNHHSSPRDAKVRQTIVAIIEEFFRVNNVTVLYICESGDGKQGMRSRLFKYWFSTFIDKDRFTMLSTSIKDIEGVSNFFAIISRNDNPHLQNAIVEFSQTVQLLGHKPNS